MHGAFRKELSTKENLNLVCVRDPGHIITNVIGVDMAIGGQSLSATASWEFLAWCWTQQWVRKGQNAIRLTLEGTTGALAGCGAKEAAVNIWHPC